MADAVPADGRLVVPLRRRHLGCRGAQCGLPDRALCGVPGGAAAVPRRGGVRRYPRPRTPPRREPDRGRGFLLRRRAGCLGLSAGQGRRVTAAGAAGARCAGARSGRRRAGAVTGDDPADAAGARQAGLLPRSGYPVGALRLAGAGPTCPGCRPPWCAPRLPEEALLRIYCNKGCSRWGGSSTLGAGPCNWPGRGGSGGWDPPSR
jgi:hypothetical protein